MKVVAARAALARDGALGQFRGMWCVRLFVAVLVVVALPGPAAAASVTMPPGNEVGAVLYVWKNERKMLLVDSGRPVREFSVRLGENARLPKRVRGDNATPEGRYFIREKKPNSRFHRFLGLNYPNVVDADRGLDSGYIDDSQWADIFFANIQRKMPPPSTLLGGRVGIHGLGGRPEIAIDWTQGCIAVTDAEIDYLFDVLAIDTPVVIFE